MKKDSNSTEQLQPHEQEQANAHAANLEHARQVRIEELIERQAHGRLQITVHKPTVHKPTKKAKQPRATKPAKAKKPRATRQAAAKAKKPTKQRE